MIVLLSVLKRDQTRNGDFTAIYPITMKSLPKNFISEGQMLKLPFRSAAPLNQNRRIIFFWVFRELMMQSWDNNFLENFLRSNFYAFAEACLIDHEKV